MQKLPFLQGKHLQQLLDNKDKTPAQEHLLKSSFLDPIQAAIQTVQQAKSNGVPVAPGDVMTDSIGDLLPAANILSHERFRDDLARLALGAKMPLDKPADRFAASMPKLRYYVWRVPQGVLETALREGKLGPAFAPARLSAAVAYLVEKFEAVDESGWNRVALERAMREVMEEREYGALLGSEDAQQDGVYKPLRWALLAQEKGLPISNTMEILGREETLRRLGVAKRAADVVAVEGPSAEGSPSSH